MERQRTVSTSRPEDELISIFQILLNLVGPQCWAVDAPLAVLAVISNFGLPRATLQMMSSKLKMIYFRQRHSKINSVLALCVSLNTSVQSFYPLSAAVTGIQGDFGLRSR